MKLLYIGTLPPHQGGSAVVGKALLYGLVRRGHQVTAIAPITAEALAQGDPLADAPFRVLRYTVPRFETAPNHPASQEFRTMEGRGIASHFDPVVSKENIDLIIAGRETFALHVPDLAASYRLPWIGLAHGATTWGLLDGSYPRELLDAIMDRLARAAKIIAVANHLAERLREKGLTQVVAIPNAVDPQEFVPAPRNSELQHRLVIKADEIIVAHISNLKSLKRPLDIVQAAKIALKQNPSLVFIIVGDGEYRAVVSEECRRSGIEDRFRFTGWIPPEQICEYINLADMVVMPSTAEAMALVYLETQACGRVLIASNIPAAQEVVEDGVNGLLFPSGDCAAMAERILQAAADPLLRKAIGDSARNVALTRPFEKALDSYEAVLAALHTSSRSS